MERKHAKMIAGLLASNIYTGTSNYRLIKHLSQKKLSGFHQWADDRPCEGAFLFKDKSEAGYWILFLEWRHHDNFYLVIFPEPKSGPIAEIHRLTVNKNESVLHWRYCPSKRDGKNDDRKAYFTEAFLSTDVQISVPESGYDVDDFIGELFSLASSRAKADNLDPDRPSSHNGFPEGKFKERLHVAKERNRELVRQAKLVSLTRNGCLKCACCGFDFFAVYGEIGKGFIEAHHTKPVSTLHEDGEETKIEELALVCSNCHRMLHRRRPWLQMDMLNQLLAPNTGVDSDTPNPVAPVTP